MSDGKAAVRMGDLYSCPLTDPAPHIGGPIERPCSAQVLIDGSNAARMLDSALCGGRNDFIMTGSGGVLIDGRPAARRFDRTMHGGAILSGASSVLIGARSVPLSPAQVLALAMIQIRNSEFAKTPEGKLILARLEDLYAAGKIKCHASASPDGSYFMDKISVSSAEMNVGKTASVLVHQGTHAMYPDGPVTLDDEPRCYRNEIAYHEELPGGTGDRHYDKSMRENAEMLGQGTLHRNICPDYVNKGVKLKGCYDH